MATKSEQKVIEGKITNINNPVSNDPTATLEYRSHKAERLLLLNLLMLAAFYPDLLKDFQYPFLFNIPLPGEFSSDKPIQVGSQDALPTTEISAAILQHANEAFLSGQGQALALGNSIHSYIFSGFSSIDTNFASQEMLLTENFQSFATNDLTTNVLLANLNHALNENETFRLNNNNEIEPTTTTNIQNPNPVNISETASTITPVPNIPPQAVDNSMSLSEDTPIVISADTLLADDTDGDGDTLTIISIGDASHGTAILNNDGTISYAPDSNFSGNDSFTYTVSDGNGGQATASVNLTIEAVADAPTLNAPTNLDTYGTIAVALNISAALVDTDGSETLSILISGVPSDGTLSAGTNNNDGSWTLTPGQLAGLTFTPANVDQSYQFTVTATSTDGSDTASTQAVIDIAVTTTPPDASDSAINGTEDITFVFAASDFNFAPDVLGNPVQNLTIETLPDDGLLERFDGNNWIPVNAGDEISIASIDAGNLRFTGDLHESGDDNFTTPGVGLNQQDYAAFEFTVSDNLDTSAPATMTIDLASVFQPAAFSDAEGYVRLYSNKYLVDSVTVPLNSGDGSKLYSITFNDALNTADFTFLKTLSTTAFLDSPQIAINNSGTSVYALETQPTDYGIYTTATNTFTTISTAAISPANPALSGMGYYNNAGTELLYVFNITSETVTSYNLNATNPFATPVNSYTAFTIDSNSVAGVGLIYDFNGGDIVFDQYGQAYAISNSRVAVSGKEGGFAKINFDNNTVTLLNDDAFNFVNLSGLIYDPTTELFYASRFTSVTGFPQDAFLAIDKSGTIVDTIPMKLNGLDFDHSGGDGASSLQVEYAVPVDLSQEDTDGSQAFTSLTLSLTNSIAGDVLGAQLFHDGVALTNGSTVNLGGSIATVSIVGQTWTLTWNDPEAVQIDDTLTFRTSTSQTADFTVNMTAVDTELSTGANGSDSVSFLYEPLKPIINDTDASITHDETSGIDAGTNDVSTATSPTIFDTLEAANSLSPTPIGQAHTGQGVLEYFVPMGMGFVSDVSLTQQNGALFSGQDTGLLSMNNFSIYLYQDSNNNMVVGREGDENGALANGAVIFALYLDQGLSQYGSSNDTLWLAQYQQILHPDSGDPNEAQSISDLVYLTVQSTTGEVTTSSDAITVTILDDNDAGPPQMMMMSMMFGGGDSGDSEIGSNNESGTMSLSMSLEDDSSSTSTDTNQNPATDNNSPPDESSITNDMVFDSGSNGSESNPVLNEQQANLDGATPETQQQTQQTADAPAGSADAVSQSMQEADQQTQQPSGG